MGNRPGWQGRLTLSYGDVIEWLEDLYLIRTRLGWPVLAADNPLEQLFGYLALENPRRTSAGPELMVWIEAATIRACSHPRARPLRDAIRTKEGRSRITEAIMAFDQQPRPEPRTVYDRILEDDIL